MVVEVTWLAVAVAGDVVGEVDDASVATVVFAVVLVVLGTVLVVLGSVVVDFGTVVVDFGTVLVDFGTVVVVVGSAGPPPEKTIWADAWSPAESMNMSEQVTPAVS